MNIKWFFAILTLFCLNGGIICADDYLFNTQIISRIAKTVRIVGCSATTISDSVLYIPSHIKIGSSEYTVTQIGRGAFDGKKSFNRVVIPDNVTRIDDGAFAYCSNLKYLILSKQLKVIKSFAFDNCIKLQSVDFPAGLIRIDMCAFRGCISLHQAVIPNTVKYIGEQAFRDCFGLEFISIAQSTKRINKHTFSNLDGVEHTGLIIWGSLFHESSLKTVAIPEGVRIIEKHAFAGNSIDSLHISSSVKHIRERAFETPGSLRAIRCDAINPPKLTLTEVPWNDSATPFSFCSIEHGYYKFKYATFNSIRTVLYVPKGAVSLYKNASGWNTFDTIIEQSSD